MQVLDALPFPTFLRASTVDPIHADTAKWPTRYKRLGQESIWP